MRKIVGLLLAVCLLTGCSAGNSVLNEPDNETDVMSDDGGLITVGFSQLGAESDWRLAATASIEAELTEEKGYHLIFEDAQQKQENQLKAIREFIDQGVDYIVLDPIVETGWDAALQEAKDANIPVIIVDRNIATGDDGLYDAWTGADFYLEGQRACAWLEQYLLLRDEADDSDEGKTLQEPASHDGTESETVAEEDSADVGAPVNIVHIQGTPDSSAQLGRSRALQEAVDTHENWNLLAADNGEFVPAKGREVMEQMLAEYGDEIDVLYCENDDMASGAIEAINAAGLKPGEDIIIVSFDCTRRGLELTLKGEIAVDTECTPMYGESISKMIRTLEEGGVLPKETYLTESQYAVSTDITEVFVDGTRYAVTELTEDIVMSRSY